MDFLLFVLWTLNILTSSSKTLLLTSSQLKTPKLLWNTKLFFVTSTERFIFVLFTLIDLFGEIKG